jgi:hypothetical protein
MFGLSATRTQFAPDDLVGGHAHAKRFNRQQSGYLIRDIRRKIASHESVGLAPARTRFPDPDQSTVALWCNDRDGAIGRTPA